MALRVPKTQFTDVQGAQVAYATFGRGSPTLFMPHWATNIETIWNIPAFVRFANKLATFARVVQFDKRGYGISDPLPHGAVPGLESACADAVAVITASHMDAFSVVAADLAGFAAIRFAAELPQYVRCLVLINTTARLRRAADYSVGLPARVVDRAVEQMRAHWVSEGDLAARQQEPSLAAKAENVEAASRYRRSTISPSTAEALGHQLTSFDLREDLHRLRCPTLVLHRRDDSYIPASHGRYLATHIRGAAHRELSGMDHTPWSGDQDEVLNAIASFLPRPQTRGDPSRPRPRDAAQFGWQAVTSAELRAVACVVEGATLKQAAAMLGLSPRTAETQLQSVYRKLGIGTRAELAIEFHNRRNDADSQTHA